MQTLSKNENSIWLNQVYKMLYELGDKKLQNYLLYSCGPLSHTLCPPTIDEESYLRLDPDFNNPLSAYSKFDIIKLAEIYKQIAHLNGLEVDYILSGFLDIIANSEACLSKCSIVAPKAGIIMGKADYMQQYKSYDNTILDINRLKSSSGGDKLTANNFLSGKPMELVIPAIIVPQQSTFIKHTPITYLSRRFISVPKNPYWPSPDQDEKTEYARLETYILLNPLFNRNSNLLPGIIKQKIHDFVYELCLVRMYEGLRESLSAEEINRLFYEFYQKKLGLNEDESKYVRTFSQKNK